MRRGFWTIWGELVRASVEETLNALLDTEAYALCGAQRYQRSSDRMNTRAGSYGHKLHTGAGEIILKMPKLRRQPFCQRQPKTAPLG